MMVLFMFLFSIKYQTAVAAAFLITYNLTYVPLKSKTNYLQY